jgi:7-dehydrocholesterol reductase
MVYSIFGMLRQNLENGKKSNELKPSWGREDRASFFTILTVLSMMTVAPVFNFLLSTTCTKFNCSLTLEVDKLTSIIPESTEKLILASFVYIGWYVFQLILYAVLPGPLAEGHTTPAGHRLSYICNGWNAWLVTHALLLCFSYLFGWEVLYFFSDYRLELLWVTTIYGFGAAVIFWIKAHLFPSHVLDRKFSNSILYDLHLGIELNPRWGKYFDWKLFHNTRIGIVAWTIINISYATVQYREYGFVSNSMILINLLQGIYTLDLFWYEAWYLRTIDIEHEHFGFYLAYGSSAWLPFFYTLQGLYLVSHPIQLSLGSVCLILLLGLGGYYIFRNSNNQKHLFRLHRVENVKISGESPHFIDAPYTTADGKEHKGRLLYSGWWGRARHVNYAGDLAMAYSWSLLCGVSHLLPWSYAIFLTILLLHRTQRDKKRCAGKYGKAWEEYCQKVPWLLIPGVY